MRVALPPACQVRADGDQHRQLLVASRGPARIEVLTEGHHLVSPLNVIISGGARRTGRRAACAAGSTWSSPRLSAAAAAWPQSLRRRSRWLLSRAGVRARRTGSPGLRERPRVTPARRVLPAPSPESTAP